MRRLLGAVAVVLVIAFGAVAWAYWSAPGTGMASTVTASLTPATIAVPATATNSVTVSFSAQASLQPSGAANSQIAYTVQRRLGGGAYADIAAGGCSGAKPFGTMSCVDAPSASGTYGYRVVASYHSWTATSADTSAVAVTVDTTPPVVQSITRLDSNPTAAASLRWTVTFSEPVTGVDATDFALARGGTLSGGAVSTVSGSGATYTVTASSGSGSGALGLNLVDDDSIVDLAGNPLSGAGAGNGNLSGQTYTVDRVAPTATAISRASSDPTNAASVQWTVSFSKSVTGVDSGDFALARTGGLTGGAVTGVTGSGTTYTVTASTGSASGALGLNLVDDDSIADALGNRLGGSGLGNGNLTGQTYTIDRTAPTASSIATADPNPTNAASVSWTVTFSESVGGVDATDFTLARGGGGVSASAAITSVSGSGTTRTVTATTVSGEGTLGLNLVTDGTIVDAVGNALSVPLTGAIYTIDRTAPTLSTLQMLDTDANGKVDEVKATFNEPLSSSPATAPWTLTNVPSGGTLASVSTSGSVATLTLNEGAGPVDTAVGAFKVALAASASGIRDLAGNQASFAATAPADLAPPVLTVMSMFDANTNGKVDKLTLTFSETLASTASASAFSFANAPSGGTPSSASVSGSGVTLNVAEGPGAADTAVGSFTVSLAASASGVRDGAGNQASFSGAVPVDKAAPVPVAVGDTNGGTDGLIEPGDTFIVTFSEPIAPATVPGSTPISEVGGGLLGSTNTLTISHVTDGALDTGTGYVGSLLFAGTVNFAGTSALSGGGAILTTTVGTCSSGCGNQHAGSSAKLTYAPAATLTDGAGNAAAGTLTTASFKIF